MELKAKVILRDKGETVVLPSSFTEMKASLKWNDPVDLDLMAFYKTKDGKTGGVYTAQLGGSLGDLNASPFIKLSGDAGVGAQGGENQEDLIISKLDNIAELHLVALNYTAQQKLQKGEGTPPVFKDYDGGVEITTDNESFGMLLDATEAGTVAYLCRIDNTGVTPKLIRENRVMNLADFVAAVPAAACLSN